MELWKRRSEKREMKYNWRASHEVCIDLCPWTIFKQQASAIVKSEQLKPCTASLGCNRVSNGKTHRCMAKVIYHGKSHGIWVLPYNGLSHGSMVKPMDIMKRYIHGFCHGTLLHGFCHALFKRKVTNCVFTQPGICFGIAAYWCQMLHCLQTPDFHFGMEI